MGQCTSDRQRAQEAALLEEQQLRECQERIRHDREEQGHSAYREDPVATFDQLLDKTSSSFDHTSGSLAAFSSTTRSDKISPPALPSTSSAGTSGSSNKFIVVKSPQTKYMISSPPDAGISEPDHVEDLE